LCSSVTDGLIDKVDILNEFVTSDHRPVYVTFNRLKGNLRAPPVSQQGCIPTMDWSKADALCINRFQAVLEEVLGYLDIRANLLLENDTNSVTQVNKYYSKIVMCITNACKTTIPYIAKGTSASDRCITG